MATPNPPPKYVKIMLYLHKKPDMTLEQFQEHWKGQHVKLALENEKFVDKVRRYNQVSVYLPSFSFSHHYSTLKRGSHKKWHTTHELKAQAADFGIPVSEYDGIAEVWVESLEDWKFIVTDPDFVRVIAADEGNFIQAPITVSLGYDNFVVGEEDWKPALSKKAK